MSIINFNEYSAETEVPFGSDNVSRMAGVNSNLWSFLTGERRQALGSSIDPALWPPLVARVDTAEQQLLALNRLKERGYKIIDENGQPVTTSLSAFFNAGYVSTMWQDSLWNASLNPSMAQIDNGHTTLNLVVISYAIIHFEGDIELELRGKITGNVPGEPGVTPEQFSSCCTLYIPRQMRPAQNLHNKIQFMAAFKFDDIPGKYSETANAALAVQFWVRNTAVMSRWQAQGTINGPANIGYGRSMIMWKESS